MRTTASLKSIFILTSLLSITPLAQANTTSDFPHKNEAYYMGNCGREIQLAGLPVKESDESVSKLLGHFNSLEGAVDDKRISFATGVGYAEGYHAAASHFIKDYNEAKSQAMARTVIKSPQCAKYLK